MAIGIIFSNGRYGIVPLARSLSSCPAAFRPAA
jgi:hypothetical protein